MLGTRFLARRYLAQLPQGRKAARVSELFRVREEPLFMPGVTGSPGSTPGLVRIGSKSPLTP